MKHRNVTVGLLLGLVMVMLAACGTSQIGGAAAGASTAATSTGASTAATAAPGGAARRAAATPTPAPTIQIARGVSAIGTVAARQDSSLTFAVQGTVDQVLVKAGDVVTKGQTLAILDTRSFDQQVEQAQAALDIAQAAQDALTEPPTAAEVAAAQAQVQQAQIALAQTRLNQPQTVDSAQTNVDSAQISLQAQTDKLSQAKTDAENNVTQTALALTKAQAAYGTAASDWNYVNSTGQNPSNPTTTNAAGKKVANKLNDTQREEYYQTFLQAEASLHQAELAVQQALVDAEAARQAEITGVQTAQQQVTQAQSGLAKVALPTNADTIAQAQVALDAAKASRAKLNPAPGHSDQEKASATIRQAQAALGSAKLSRANAELRAPFDGVVAEVNIAPGDPSSVAGQVPIRIVDISTLHIDVSVNSADIGRVTQGQAVQVIADAATTTVYPGKVTYIAPAATVSGNVSSYLVNVALNNQAGLRPGMSVRVMFAGQFP